jgi:molybdate/tungstate transport system substrate-binding protein
MKAVRGFLILALIAFTAPGASLAHAEPIEVAYAGSMGALMDRGIGPEIARSLGAELRGRAQGSTGLANLIVAGSIRPDVFIAVTPSPMRTVLKAGKAECGIPIARTEMVIVYSPRSRYATQFARRDGPPWWQILEHPDLRFGRTDPNADPQGLNVVFMFQLAEAYYHQPRLADRILGPQLNPRQIFQEPEVMARLQAGQLDASAAYKSQPEAMGLPFVALPREINLGDAALAKEYRAATVMLNGKTLHPLPLVFYAAVLRDAPHRKLADCFLAWLEGADARAIMTRYHYDPPGDAEALAP